MENYEKKYKEVLEKAAALYKASEPMSGCNVILETLFPELKESEDEKVKNKLINLIKMSNEAGGFALHKWEADEMLAWIEKQGEHANFLSKIQVGDKVTRNENGVLVNLSQLERVAKPRKKQGDHAIYNVPAREVILAIWDLGNEWKELTNGCISTEYGTQLDYIQKHWCESEYYLREKQDEKKPADKEEPKFHEGEWITNGDYIWKIVEVKPLDYILQSQDGNVVDDTISHVDEQFHSFTIEDAKDGDVLVCNINKAEIGGDIEKLPNITPTICVYQNVVKDKDYIHTYFSLYNGSSLVLSNSMYYNTFVYNIHPATKKQRNLLFQKMKEAGYEWDDEKKELKKISQRMVSAEAKEALYDKHTWSEEDEKIMNGLIDSLTRISLNTRTDSTSPNYTFYKEIDWLKSLRPQNKWKPSELQLGCLSDAIEHYNSSGYPASKLKELYEQLKKL